MSIWKKLFGSNSATKSSPTKDSLSHPATNSPQVTENTNNLNAVSAKTANPSLDAQKVQAAFDNAVRDGNAGLVQQMLDFGANPNAKNFVGMTSLHSAATLGHKRIAELLLAHGADVRAKDGIGNTPLHNAESKGHTEIADLLSKHEKTPIKASSFQMKVTNVTDYRDLFRELPGSQSFPGNQTFPNGFLEGVIERGKIKVGDKIFFNRSNKRNTIIKIAVYGQYVESVEVDSNTESQKNVSLRFDSNFDKSDAQRGDIIYGENI